MFNTQYSKLYSMIVMVCAMLFCTSLLGAEESFTQLDATICQGEKYNFNEKELVATGVYMDTLVNTAGYDSIVALNLTVNPSYLIQKAVTICYGESYHAGGDTFNESGLYELHLSTLNDCDSLVYLQLTVLPQLSSSKSPVICKGESIKVGNHTYTVSGNYVDTLKNNLGCDSIVYTQLTVIQPVINETVASICKGKSYSWNGNLYTQAGTYRDTLNSHLGCDSILVLKLSVINSQERNINVTVCHGNSYTVGNHTYTSTGSYSDTLVATSNGCDSIIHLQLNVLKLDTLSIYKSICKGQSYVFAGQTYTTSGVYSHTYENTLGCDSIVTLNLKVINPVTTRLNPIICEGEKVKVGTHTYTVTGNYTDSLISSKGCDSIVITNLTVLPRERTILDPIICAGSSFQVGNNFYSVSGTYIDTLRSQSNCDSIVTTHLTVTNAYNVTKRINLCQGDVYHWNGNDIQQNGVYKDTLVSQIGCDSIVTLIITFFAPTQKEIAATICNGQSYMVGTHSYSVSGNYIDTLKSTLGCDSIVKLNLTVLNKITQSVNATICEGKSFAVGDSVYTSAGIYTVILKAQNGCDSIVNLNLKVALKSYTTLRPTLCKGQKYQVGTHLYSVTGTYYDTLLNVSLCDSIITTHLTIQNPTSEQITRTICTGQSITIGSNTYSQQGLYTDTLHSVFGCDSIIKLRLMVQDVITFSQSVNVCQGDSIVIGGNVYKTTGTYIDTLVSSGGCDSVVTTKVTIRPVFQHSFDRNLCQGDSIIFGNKIIKSGGQFTNKYQSIYACDSIVTLNVSLIESSYEVKELNSCEGKTIKVGNVNYSRDTIFVTKFSNQYGCDSTIEYRLKFYPKYNLNVQQNACIGSTVYNVLIERDTLLHLNLKSYYGCDSIVHLQLKAVSQKITERYLEICYGSEYLNVPITKDTIFVQQFTSSQGCDSLVVDTILVLPAMEMTYSADTTVNPGSAVTLFASGAYTYAWSTGETSPSIVVRPTVSTIYTVTGSGINGCSQKVSIAVSVNACQISGANYFTPNGDGQHDKWKLKGTECLSEYRIKIINRWGDIVFESESSSEDWRGTYKDKDVPEGVYFYILEGLSAHDQSLIQQNGYIHLER
ncbi:MAG: gliding motility-associated C-terminal domain-containing protein [Chitinophagales bacterium]|nr:gliding motility-associated C-terminal domain-containing protein [Chitinophagales bacterium]